MANRRRADEMDENLAVMDEWLESDRRRLWADTLKPFKIRNNTRRDEDKPELREAVDDIYLLLGHVETLLGPADAARNLAVVVDEVQRRLDAVVDAAVEWRFSDLPIDGESGAYEMSDKLEDAIDRLLELRDKPDAAMQEDDPVVPGEGPSSTEYEKWLATRPGLIARFDNKTFTKEAGYEIWRNAWLVQRDVYHPLLAVLKGVAERKMSDGSPCWCAEPFDADDDHSDHSDYCTRARVACAKSIEVRVRPDV